MTGVTPTEYARGKENEKIQSGRFLMRRFKSLRRYFAFVSMLLLGAVGIVTVISMSYTRQSILKILPYIPTRSSSR